MSPPADTKPKRLSLAELVPQLVTALQHRGSDHSSVELVRNAKGDVQIRVSVRTGEAGIETPEQAAVRARLLFDGLAAEYAAPGTYTPAAEE